MKMISIAILIFSFSTFADSSCNHDSKNFNCVKYVRNYDADTITFNIPGIHPLIGNKVNIRVNGVDTPELRTKNTCEKTKARNAKKLVQNLLKNAKRIDLKNVGRGKYFRIVADVMIDGKSLSDYLLKNSLAYPYQGKKKKKVDWCNYKRSLAGQKN